MADVGVRHVGVAPAFAVRVHGGEGDMLAVVDQPVVAAVDRLQDLEGEVAVVDRQEAAGLGAEHRVSPPGPKQGLAQPLRRPLGWVLSCMPIRGRPCPRAGAAGIPKDPEIGNKRDLPFPHTSACLPLFSLY